jgi:hypothetical protein
LAPAQPPGLGTNAFVCGEVIWSRRSTGSPDIVWTGEKPSNGSWIWAHVSQGILRCSQFEENVYVLSGFLIPARCVRFDFNAQIRIASKELLKQRRYHVAGHDDGTGDLISPLGLDRWPSTNWLALLRVCNACLHDCRYSFPESVRTRPRGLRLMRRTLRCCSSRVSALLTVEVGICNSFAAAVSVPACATATNARTSLRSRSFISSSFFSHTPRFVRLQIARCSPSPPSLP